jgi:hypothetical protein
MLDAKVIDRIRESVEAQLRPRDQPVRVQLQAARQPGQGGRAMFARGEIGSVELAARADLIWQIIRRCFAAYQTSEVNDGVVAGLCQQLKIWIAHESNLLRGIIDMPEASGHQRASFLTMVTSIEPGLVKKYENEAKFYVQDLMNPPKKPEQSNVINVLYNYGSIAAGSSAQAHTQITDNTQLIHALEQLRTAFQQTSTMHDDQRADILGVVDDAISAARESKPNKLRLWGLLKGVGVAVSLLADAPDAWHSVQAAAKLLGIDLP